VMATSTATSDRQQYDRCGLLVGSFQPVDSCF